MDEITVTPTQYAGAVGRRWLMIALIVAVTVGAATAYSLNSPKKYEGEANILVTPFEDSSNAFVGVDLLRDGATGVYTAGRLLTTPQLVDAANRRLGLGLDRRQLLKRVEIRPLQQSNLVAIRATSRSPAEAARIANALADTLIDQRRRAFQRQVRAAIADLERAAAATKGEGPQAVALGDRLATLRAAVAAPDPTLDIFSRAVPAATPVSPKPKLNILVGFVAGLLLAAIAALVAELLDPRLHEDDELGRLPILAAVPRASDRLVRAYLRGRGALPPDLWEAYRTLRASLGRMGPAEGAPRTVLVTSAMQGEGKTMTSVNLAITLAAGGARVILVDGDFRRPMVASALSVEPPQAGLSSLLAGTSSVEEALVPAPGRPGLRLVLGGSESALDLLEARRVLEVLDRLKRDADIVIVDSPPITEFADAHVLADAVDIVLVAIRLGHSREDEFNQLRRFLAQHGVAPAGFIVTTRERARRGGNAAPPSEQSPRPGQRDLLRVAREADGARAVAS